MSIEKDVACWNGKSASDIDAIYSRHSDDISFVSNIIVLCEQEHLQKGATWLVKRYLDDGHRLEVNEIAALYKQLPKFEAWEAKLHILQCMPDMPVGEAEKKRVEGFLRNCLADSNKFVRAWAYNGFYELSLQYPEYKIEAKQFLTMAMRDEAPSVKARIRNIVKRSKIS